MFKIIILIVLGAILMGMGVYTLSTVSLSAFSFDFLNFLFNWNLPTVNWALVGIVTMVASAAIFGSAFVATKMVR